MFIQKERKIGRKRKSNRERAQEKKQKRMEEVSREKLNIDSPVAIARLKERRKIKGERVKGEQVNFFVSGIQNEENQPDVSNR